MSTKQDELQPRWQRRAAVARYLSTSDMTVQRWEKDPRIGFPRGVRVNGVTLYDIEAIDAWLIGRAKKQAAG